MRIFKIILKRPRLVIEKIVIVVKSVSKLDFLTYLNLIPFEVD